MTNITKRRAPIPFIIWCNQRSGSTHLSSLLANHPDLTCWRELLFAGEGTARDDLFTRSGCKNVTTFIDSFFSLKWRHIGIASATPVHANPVAVGFKLKYQQAVRHAGLIGHLKAKEDRLRVIHLVRRNALATLVSIKLLPTTFSIFKDANAPALSTKTYHPRVYISPRTVVSQLLELEHGLHLARSMVAGMDTIEIFYEDLVTHQATTISRVLTHLGADLRPKLNSSYRKLLPTSPYDVISNSEEIKDALKGTPFEHYNSSSPQ